MRQPTFPIPPKSPSETLPTMYDLPSEDPQESGLPDEYHALQPQLLSRTFSCPSYPPQQVFTGTDLNLYYDVNHTQWYKRPDWFLVVGVPRLYQKKDMRNSYVIWQEGVNPFVVVELLSPGTAEEDLGKYAEIELEIPENNSLPEEEIKTENGQTVKTPRKWEVYEQILRIPYYVVFSRYTDRLRFFQLINGNYQEQTLDPENPRIWVEELEVGLGLWSGEFEGITRKWLRWYNKQGQWIPTDSEQASLRAQQERRKAQQALEQAERERQRAEQTEIQLRQVILNLLQSGMTVEQVATITVLGEEQINAIVQGER